MNRNACLALGFFALLAGPAFAQPKPGIQAPIAPSVGAPALSIRNRTPNVIKNVYKAAGATQAWGQDQIGSSEIIRTGTLRAFLLPAGECTHDIRIIYQGNISDERRRIYAFAEQTLELPLAAQRAR